MKQARSPSLGIAVLAVALSLAGCGSPEGPRGESADGPKSTEALGPDLERGELLSFACQACHTLGAGQKHLVGPNLFGVIGRPAASLPDFEYSDALRRSGIVWTPQVIDAWLKDPASFLPGNNMPFSGYRSASDRRDLVAYIVAATAPSGR